MNIGMLEDPLVKEELDGVAEKEKDEIINFKKKNPEEGERTE